MVIARKPGHPLPSDYSVGAQVVLSTSVYRRTVLLPPRDSDSTENHGLTFFVRNPETSLEASAPQVNTTPASSKPVGKFRAFPPSH